MKTVGVANCPEKSVSKNIDESLRGERFGMLTVIGFERVQYPGGSIGWKWICRCDCGTIKSVSPSRVRSGNTVSCGCHRSKQTAEWNRTAKRKHGGRYDRLYHCWRGMKDRCLNPRNKDYCRYGGRGITVCEDWVNDYAAFRDWANSNGYSDDLTIDRIDVNGSYSPSNCRWATPEQQARNRTTNVSVCYNGKAMSFAQAVEESGIGYNTAYRRYRAGYKDDDIFFAGDLRRKG